MYTCVYLFKFRTVFVPFTGYPSCGFQNCFSPHLLLSQGLLFSVSSCPYLICALPLSCGSPASLFFPFLLGPLSSLPLFLIACLVCPPDLLCAFSPFLVYLFHTLLSHLSLCSCLSTSSPLSPLYLHALLSWHLRTSPACTGFSVSLWL